MKPQRAVLHEHQHVHHHKPIAERYQTLITCSVAIALIFAVIFGVGWYVPLKPLPSAEAMSKLGLDSASRLSAQERRR